MNAQQIFDKVATHLLTQKKRALSKGKLRTCLYRAPDGRKCAAGCLISDRLYHENMEQTPIDMVIGTFRLPRFFLRHSGLISDLQHVHDGSQPNKWRQRLGALARRRGLNTDALTRV